ncbi:hypothetical protein UPYG_G00067890 [Umbra pygmaea]|uniref:Glycosyl hydrolases family 22 (GH22) domain-containing protein n=1 Tax=Umbra pygmaea TaxID=75934 RepID=A0ABD0XVL3_UMBPY
MKLELLLMTVAALVTNLSEGRLVSKCELETKLTEAANQFNLTEKILTNGIQLNELLAKLICSLDVKSGLNTSLVTNLQIPFSLRTFWHNSPAIDTRVKLEGLHSEGLKNKSRSTGRPLVVNSNPTGKLEEVRPHNTRMPEELSDRLTCISSNTTYSRNLCNTECSSFLDDDISDDIACFVKSNAWVRVMNFTWKCAKMQASEYFQCNQQ